MTSEPLVSVIVVTRNSTRTLDDCLASIRNQTYTPIELIVVDNGSTDETLSVARRYSDIVETFGPERSAQRNRGAESSHGEYVLFIDSDMHLSPGVVRDCVDAMVGTKAPGVVIPEVSVGEGFLARSRALERRCYVGDDEIESARFFSKKAFDAAGGFDERLTGTEDKDLMVRVAVGRRLPRTSSYITHYEGRVRIGPLIDKRRYYTVSSVHYWHKHGRSSVRQANIIFRPAFIRNWRLLARHPLLTSGILFLKTLETLGIAWGLAEAWVGALGRRGAAPTSF